MGAFDFLKKALGGDEPPEKRPGRNDPCWCGSGKKYKRCHLESDERKRSAALAAAAAACRGPT